MCGLIAGCGAAFQSKTPELATVSGSSLRGGVHGGQQPVSGARLYLFAAATTGYASAPTSLLNGPGISLDESGNGYVLSDQNGLFTITGDYQCPTPDRQMYLEALGGNPGLGTPVNNPAIALVAALGPCSGLASLPFIQINEISTVVAAFGLAHFANIDPTRGSAADAIATSSANTTGLNDAFATIANIADLTTGHGRNTTLSGTGQVDVPTINSLANVLASCVNSDGTGPLCASLMSLSQPVGGTLPVDTFQAALDVVLNPTHNFAQLAALQSATPPFQPTLISSVGYVLAVTYTGVPVGFSPVFDSMDNLWTTNGASLYEMSVTGVPLSGANGFNSPLPVGAAYKLAIDTQDNVWMTNRGSAASVLKFSNSGTLLSPTAGFTGNGLNLPISIAIDSFNDVWVLNELGTAVSEFASDGSPIRNIGTIPPSFVASVLGIDGGGNVWISSGYVQKLDGSGSPLPGSPFSNQAAGEAISSAFDAQGNAWFAGIVGGGAGGLEELASDGTSLLSLDPGATGATSVVIGGNDTVWIGTEFYLEPLKSDGTLDDSFLLQPAPANSHTLLDVPVVDRVGNLWINRGGSITEYVGLAGPITTPTALAVKNNAFGRRP